MNSIQIIKLIIFFLCSNCRTILIPAIMFIAIFNELYAQEITFPPNTPICTFDLNSDGDASAIGELEACGSGQLYNPISDLPGPTIALSCPLSKTACERPIVNTCDIDSSPCGEFDAVCSRPQACVSIAWDDDLGPGTVTYVPAVGGQWYCAENNTTYSSVILATAECRLSGPIMDTVIFIDGAPDTWFCTRNSTGYLLEANAITACTYIGDIGPGLLVITPPVSEGWYCAENYTAYFTAADAITGCRILNHVNGFDCPSTAFNDKHLTSTACETSCTQSGACALVTGSMQCPLGGFNCINEFSGSEDYFCSPSLCTTYEVTGEFDPVDSSFAPNDGTVNSANGCLDEIQIFNGKAESCRLPGIASAYQNCCKKADEDLLTDSQGSVSESILWALGVTAVIDAAGAAYTAYSAATVGSIGQAASVSGSAFQGALVDGLTSTTMIVAVGVAAVTTYLENACPPEGVVTAIKKKSNQCVLIGEKCTTKILGSCVQKREVHCCFNSVMATLIQVGGRDQLGMDFGTIDAPNCRGFTPNEFQSLDFSKIDLTTYYTEINTRAQGDIENEITTVMGDATDGI